MRTASTLLVGTLLAIATFAAPSACTSFSGEPEPDGGRGDGALPLDGAGDGAPESGDGGGTYCQTLVDPLAKFCADFETDKIAPFEEGDAFIGDYVTVQTVQGRKALQIKGTDIPAGSDDDRVETRVFEGPFTTITASFALYVNNASPIELLTLHNENQVADDINLYLDGKQLKIRHNNNDMGEITVPLGSWQRILFTVTANNSVLRLEDGTGPTANAASTDARLRSLGNRFMIGAGVWYKQGNGNVDIALDDIALSATP